MESLSFLGKLFVVDALGSFHKFFLLITIYKIFQADRNSDCHGVVYTSVCSLILVKLDLRLHLAAWSGQAKVVEYLCKKADVGAAAMDDMGAIHFAAQKGHLDVVRMLVTSGVSVKSINRKGMTALHYAAQGSHIELAKYLIKKGSNVNAKNKAGKTPVDLATSEELRSVLLNKELSNSKEKDPQAEPNSSSQENEANAGGEVEDGEKDAENEKDESVKRKSDEGRSSSEVMPEAKKSKVSLNHLLAADDTQEEEEEENL